MRVHVINLDRSTGRLAEFTRINGQLSELSRFPAVDGVTLDVPSLSRLGLVTDDIDFTMASIGCCLSHVGLWDVAIASGQSLTIAEDDAILHRQFDEYSAGVIASLPADWDLVVWGWNFDLFIYFELLPGVSGCLAQFDQETRRGAIGAFQHQSLSPRAFPLIWAFGTPCYAVSVKGARELKARVLPFRPLTVPFPEGLRAVPSWPRYHALGIDGALNSVYRELNAFICFPPLAITTHDLATSTIQDFASAGDVGPGAA